MKLLIFIGFFIIKSSVYGQSAIIPTKISSDNMTMFIDSLKTKIINDTIKFDRKDLIHSNQGTRNTKSYSSLFIVDMEHEYLLDIVNGQKVSEFINEFLDPKKIKTIEIFSAHDSQSMFGTKGTNGVILIEINKGIKRHYNVAGLEHKKKRGPLNNFNQRKDGEIKIVF